MTPAKSNIPPPSTPKALQSSAVICQKQKSDVETHKVITKCKGIRMLEIASKLDDKVFFIRLNTLPDPADAVDNDVLYHEDGWVYKQRESNKTLYDEQNYDQIAEIINIVKSELMNPTTTVLDMNNINTTTVLDMNNINTTTVLDMNNINTTTVF